MSAAPGNEIVTAAATQANASAPTWNLLATSYYGQLATPVNIDQTYRETQMMLSGTSIAAPSVSGAVALMLHPAAYRSPTRCTAPIGCCTGARVILADRAIHHGHDEPKRPLQRNAHDGVGVTTVTACAENELRVTGFACIPHAATAYTLLHK